MQLGIRFFPLKKDLPLYLGAKDIEAAELQTSSKWNPLMEGWPMENGWVDTVVIVVLWCIYIHIMYIIDMYVFWEIFDENWYGNFEIDTSNGWMLISDPKVPVENWIRQETKFRSWGMLLKFGCRLVVFDKIAGSY